MMDKNMRIHHIKSKNGRMGEEKVNWLSFAQILPEHDHQEFLIARCACLFHVCLVVKYQLFASNHAELSYIRSKNEWFRKDKLDLPWFKQIRDHA